MTTGAGEVSPAGSLEPPPIVPPASIPPPKIIGYCRACGRTLDEVSARHAYGTIYCAEHLPQPEAQSPYTVPPYHAPASPYAAPFAAAGQPGAPPPIPLPPGQRSSPGLAFILGCIPGVGAVYNGQYAKGLIHVIIFGLLISIVSTGNTGGLEPLFGILISCFWFYMAFEAYHTAKKRNLGQPLDEFSSILPMGGAPRRFPAGPVVLIAVGVLFLLSNLGLLEIHRLLRYWPALLIVMGVYMLWARTTAANGRRP